VHAPDPSTTLYQSQLHTPDTFQALVRRVEWKLVEMPLPRLQVVGNSPDPFIYDIGWDSTIRRRDPSTKQFDNQIRFRPDVNEYLVQLNGLLRPLIQRKWAAMVYCWYPQYRYSRPN
jgi:hypothetical protein